VYEHSLAPSLHRDGENYIPPWAVGMHMTDEPEWRKMIVGDRMAVDADFKQRVDRSRFSRQEWGLIMTATEFEIRVPDSEDAELVADTSDVSAVIPEFDRLAEMQGGPPAPGNSTNIVQSVKDALGLGGDAEPDREQLDAIERLTAEYARELQSRLESQGRWEAVRLAAAEAETTGTETGTADRDET